MIYWADMVILSLYCYSEQILLWWADTFIVSRYNSIVLVHYIILQYVNIHYTTWKNYNSLSWIPALSITRSVNLNNDGNILNHWLKCLVLAAIADSSRSRSINYTLNPGSHSCHWHLTVWFSPILRLVLGTARLGTLINTYPTESKIIDRFWHSRCLSNLYDRIVCMLCYWLPSGQNLNSKKLFYYCGYNHHK